MPVNESFFMTMTILQQSYCIGDVDNDQIKGGDCESDSNEQKE
jgi:hypothetical protein